MPKMRPKGRTNMCDGGFNRPSGECLFACRTELISSTSACECGQYVCPLLFSILTKPLILYFHSFQEPPPPVKAPNLLLVGGGGDTVSLVRVRVSELSKESASGGGGEMAKFVGTCVGRRDRKAKVSSSFVMWWSLDRLSAMTLCLPLMCWLYSAESLSNNSNANLLATLSWFGWFSPNDALYSQPRAEEESVNAMIFTLLVEFSVIIWMVIVAARNSSKFMLHCPTCSSGSLYRHACPFEQYPPKPWSHASENAVCVRAL